MIFDICKHNQIECWELRGKTSRTLYKDATHLNSKGA